MKHWNIWYVSKVLIGMISWTLWERRSYQFTSATWLPRSGDNASSWSAASSFVLPFISYTTHHWIWSIMTLADVHRSAQCYFLFCAKFLSPECWWECKVGTNGSRAGTHTFLIVISPLSLLPSPEDTDAFWAKVATTSSNKNPLLTCGYSRLLNLLIPLNPRCR